jgi:DNA-directed RNA polymerase subunit M/transcription elongation factor TFIIS
MIKCQTCGTQNLSGSQYCDECGAMLVNREKNYNRRQDTPNFQTQMSDVPVFQSSNATSVGIPAINEVIKEAEKSLAESKTARAKGIHSTLTIERGDSVGTEFTLAAEESYIGRWDADNGVFPDVDLDAHDPEAKVSRRHARIIFENGKHKIEDLGSTNGTFVNRGRRLIPGNAQPINNGDEIIVGKTFMRFYVNQ